jgi:YfiH family protein
MADDNRRDRAAIHAGSVPPLANPAFHWTRETWGRALRARPLEPHAQHLFTSAQLRLPAHAPAADQERAWSAVARSLAAARDRILRVRQVHGRQVRVVRAGDSGVVDTAALPDGDAIVSNVSGLALAVVVADCVPLLLVDVRAGAAAAIHAGWRGTCAGVTRAAVDAMTGAWGTNPADIVAAIGPGIGAADYEVGESLLDAFSGAGHAGAVPRWFTRGHGVLRLDLGRANVDQLVAAGVDPARILSCGLSTFAHPGWLESYRRDGAEAGRMVAAVVVPAPSRG